MDQILRLNEFFVEGGRQELSHVLLHITEPSTPDEMDKGYFFAICEINNADAAYINRLQAVIDQAENDYYEISDQAEKNSLELLLEKINQETPTLTKPGVDLHCVIGAIRQPEVFFAYHGNPRLVLFYKDRHGSYQKMDLIASPDDDRHLTEPGQLFSQIVQGKISPHDYLFAGTPHIIDYFNYDRLEKIITTRPALESARHLERVLGELKNGYSFGGLIIHLSESTDQRGNVKKIIASPERTVSTTSLRGLFRTEQRTSHTLSASFIPRLKDTANALFHRNIDNRRAQKERLVPQRMVPTEINAPHAAAYRPKKLVQDTAWSDYFAAFKETAPKIIMAILRGAWNLLLILLAVINTGLRTIGLLVIVATNYQNRRRTIIEDWKRSWHSHQENFKQLSFLTKALIIAAVVAGLVFVSSLIIIRYRQNKQMLAQQFQTSLQLIKTKIDTAESALIYKDDANAIDNYSAAETLFTNLVCRTKEQQTACTDLKKQLQNLAERTRKITVVRPNLLADWKSVLGNYALHGVNKVDTKLVAYSDATSSLYIYDLLTKKITTLPAYGGATGFTEGTVPKENDYALLATRSKNWIKYTPSNNSLASVETAYPNEKVAITGGDVYNRRLYTLDAINHQIYRHDSIKTGFGLGNEWLKETAPNLAASDDLAIDGDMYVLETNGQIEKFTAGLKVPFQIQGLYPALTHGGKIWTYTDLNTLYILDSAERRLILVDKDGHLKAQLTAAEFKEPNGLALDIPNATAYITDGSRLFSLPIPQ